MADTRKKGAWSRLNPRNYGVEDFVESAEPAAPEGPPDSNAEVVVKALSYLEDLKNRK